jgi:hypothetical protein
MTEITAVTDELPQQSHAKIRPCIRGRRFRKLTGYRKPVANTQFVHAFPSIGSEETMIPCGAYHPAAGQTNPGNRPISNQPDFVALDSTDAPFFGQGKYLWSAADKIPHRHPAPVAQDY